MEGQNLEHIDIDGNAGTRCPADPAAKKKLIANELAKMAATALNNSAVAAVIASVVGPAASDLYGITTPKSPYRWEFGIPRFARTSSRCSARRASFDCAATTRRSHASCNAL
jgi:hypothetical protein